MRRVILLALSSTLVVAGCGSSTSPASPSASVAAKTSAPVSAAGASARPSVGPTNPAQSPNPKPAVINLEVIKRAGATIVIAPVIIHGHTYPFVVDTGATATLIDETYATRLGLKKTKSAPIPIQGVAGGERAFLATISDWQIGRAKIPTSTITISTLNLGGDLVGLLGSDVLSTFGKVTIDYANQKAALG